MNDMREVTLRTSKVYKQQIPHLVTNDSSQSTLIMIIIQKYDKNALFPTVLIFDGAKKVMILFLMF